MYFFVLSSVPPCIILIAEFVFVLSLFLKYQCPKLSKGYHIFLFTVYLSDAWICGFSNDAGWRANISFHQ